MSEIYTYLVVLILFLWAIHKIFFPREKLYFCISVGVVLFVVLGLRSDDVGVDLGRYSSHYYNIEHMKNVAGAIGYNALNPAFWALNYVATLFGFSFQGFVLIVSIICVSSIIFFVYRNTSLQLLAFFCFLGMGVFTFLFSGLKQSLAMSTALFFFDAQFRSRIKYSLFWLTLSIMFHWASIVLIPMLLLGKLKMTKMLALIYVVAFVLLLLFSRSFGEAITLLMVESYAGHYESSGDIGGTAILSLTILILYVFLIYNRQSKIDTYILHGLVILCMIQMCASYAYAFTRVNLFYMEGIMSVVVSLIGNRDRMKKSSILYKARRGVAFSFSLLWVLIMIHLFWGHISSEKISEYSFYWDKI